MHTEQAVKIAPDGLHGDLVVSERTTAVVLFAHGSGSSRHSQRNRYVASVLQQGGLATLRLDLLTAAITLSSHRPGRPALWERLSLPSSAGRQPRTCLLLAVFL